MNKINSFLSTLAILLFALSACQDGNDFGDGYTPSLEKSAKPDPVKDNISISPTSLPDFISDGETKTVTVTANNNWSMSEPNYQGTSAGWLTLSPSSGTFAAGTKEISITASKNTSNDSRTATITFTCGTATPVILTVTQQENPAPFIYIDGNNSLTIEKDGGEQTVKVSTNDSPFTAKSGLFEPTIYGATSA